MFNFFKKKDKEVEQEEVAAVKEITLYAIANGDLINIEDVSDPVFAQKMMGDGFAIKPTDGSISSPVEGKITNIFPTKHAIGLDAHGLEVLIHMGIDTVSLSGGPFTISTAEDASVGSSDKLAQVDLVNLAQEDKDDVMVVVFTNGDDVIESLEITASGQVEQGDVIGHIKLK